MQQQSSAPPPPEMPGRMRPQKRVAAQEPAVESADDAAKGLSEVTPSAGVVPPLPLAEVLSTQMGTGLTQPGSHPRDPNKSSASIPVVSDGELMAMRNALAAAEKHMETEVRRSAELARDMHAMVEEGKRVLASKAEKRVRKEKENLAKLAAGRAGLETLRESVLSMKDRQLHDLKARRDKLKAAIKELNELSGSESSEIATRKEGQSQVEAEELARLEKEEESLKSRFADLRKTILGRFPGPGDDLDRATRRIDMEERVAMERQANKKAAMLNAMSNVKISLDTENTDIGREMKRKKLALKQQKQDNEDWEKSCKEWSAAMEVKMQEAGRNVASLEKKIADDQRKWDEVTKLQLEAQLSRVQLESDARIAELQRKDAKMHRTIAGMRDALSCAEKSRGPEGGFGMATLQSLRLFSEHAKVFRLMQKQLAVAAHTPRSSSGSVTSRSGESSEANSPRDASTASSPRDTSPPSIRSYQIPELNVEAPQPSSHPGASAIPTAATTEKPFNATSFAVATDTPSTTQAIPKTAATDAIPSTQLSAASVTAPAAALAPVQAAPVDTDPPAADDNPPTPQWQPFKSQVRRGGAGPAAGPAAGPGAAQGQGAEEADATLDVGSSAVPDRVDGSGGASTRAPAAASDERDGSAPVDVETLLKTRTGRFAGTFNSTPAEREKAAAERVVAARAAAAASSGEASARAGDPKTEDRGDYDEEVEAEVLDGSPCTAQPVQLGKWGMDWDFMAGKRRSEMAGAQPESTATASGGGQKAVASGGASNPAPAPGHTNGLQAAASSAVPDTQLGEKSSAIGAESSASSSSSFTSRSASTTTAWVDTRAESSSTAAAPGPSASTAPPRSASTSETTTTTSRPPEPSRSSPPETTPKPKLSYEERAAAVKAKRASELAAAREEAAARERLRQRQRDAAAEELSEKRGQHKEKAREEEVEEPKSQREQGGVGDRAQEFFHKRPAPATSSAPSSRSDSSSERGSTTSSAYSNSGVGERTRVGGHPAPSTGDSAGRGAGRGYSSAYSSSGTGAYTRERAGRGAGMTAGPRVPPGESSGPRGPWGAGPQREASTSAPSSSGASWMPGSQRAAAGGAQRPSWTADNAANQQQQQRQGQTGQAGGSNGWWSNMKSNFPSWRKDQFGSGGQAGASAARPQSAGRTRAQGSKSEARPQSAGRTRPQSANPASAPTTEQERIKDEIHKQLHQKYQRCDVCATMQALGINVAGGTEQDVRKAYKKAALKFHPDRNRQADLRTQVHAEVAWGLISSKYDAFFATPK